MIIPEVGAALSAAGALMSDLATEYRGDLRHDDRRLRLRRRERVLDELDARCRDVHRRAGRGAVEQRRRALCRGALPAPDLGDRGRRCASTASGSEPTSSSCARTSTPRTRSCSRISDPESQIEVVDLAGAGRAAGCRSRDAIRVADRRARRRRARRRAGLLRRAGWSSRRSSGSTMLATDDASTGPGDRRVARSRRW